MIDVLTICLPTDDRARSAAFYRAGFGFAFEGELEDDGLPEPLQFILNDHTRLMMIPRGGFEYTLSGALIADPAQHSSLLNFGLDMPEAVNDLFARTVAAGATVHEAPNRKPWGYMATVADPDGHPWLLRCD